MKSNKITIYVDGGSRGNPGPAGIGVVIMGAEKNKIKELWKYIGETTNNVAEYTALLHGLEEATNLHSDDIIVNMDSELVVRQLNGEYKVKSVDIKPLFEKAVGMLRNFRSFEIKHIDREKNKEADKLVNKAINLSSLF